MLTTLALILGPAPAQDAGKADKKEALPQKIAASCLVVVGKVIKTGLSVASSFDVGIIEIREVLKGDGKTKTIRFRFISSGSGQVAPYGKVGVEGVWVLGGKGDTRTVLEFLPLKELGTVKDILAKRRQGEPGEK
jgi:hypothetical protein